MNTAKLGWYSLITYVALSIISWVIIDASTELFALITLSISSLVSIILWYESIRLGMKKRIIDGIIVSLFFIIPYSLILLTTYSAFFRDELRDAFNLLAWTVFSHPFRIIPQEIAHINSVTFSAFEPLGIMVLLFLLNMITAKLHHNNRTK